MTITQFEVEPNQFIAEKAQRIGVTINSGITDDGVKFFSFVSPTGREEIGYSEKQIEDALDSYIFG
jgi:hypothetical protein